MLPEFPMKSFFHAAILSLGLLPGIISTGTALINMNIICFILF